MQRTLLFKILAIMALTLLICIPLAMINLTITERAQFREQAVASIAADSVREQTITGPILVIRYTDEFDEVIKTPDGDKIKTEVVARSVERTHLVFPNELGVDSSIKTDRRYRGIHQVLVYSGQHTIAGDFVLPLMNELPRASAKSVVRLDQASIALGIGDVRGIRNIPKIDWAGEVVEFEQGTGLTSVASGLHANLPALALAAPARVKFSFALGLDGIERQHFVPLGKSNKFTVKSDWPHPQFSGDFLPSPRERTINDSGFSATWNISSLSTMAQKQLRAAEDTVMAPDAPRKATDKFSIGFIEPVNVYSLAERATKYGLLFVALTFAAFFVFEIMKQLPIHPVQYLLVGLALVLFFLLLVSLSEHIAFAWAYLAASVGCIVLIGFYLSFVLHNWYRGMGFGVALTLLYGALYGLLISENNALVLGSLLLFTVLAAVMVATRKVDWYQVGKADPVAAA
ncbi:cell envelope integrity protein CreD [Massilia sp. TSP1-1-2]|uniref:cell envelope integrity protein CreD n=1 Tax=Massilia sp. TSP1-1-2 TaxID=2804649 RepID=UPI003CE7A561